MLLIDNSGALAGLTAYKSQLVEAVEAAGKAHSPMIAMAMRAAPFLMVVACEELIQCVPRVGLGNLTRAMQGVAPANESNSAESSSCNYSAASDKENRMFRSLSPGFSAHELSQIRHEWT